MLTLENPAMPGKDCAGHDVTVLLPVQRLPVIFSKMIEEKGFRCSRKKAAGVSMSLIVSYGKMGTWIGHAKSSCFFVIGL